MKKKLVALLLAAVMVSLACCVAIAETKYECGSYKSNGPQIYIDGYWQDMGSSPNPRKNPLKATATITLNGKAYNTNNPTIVYSGPDIKVGAEFNDTWRRMGGNPNVGLLPMRVSARDGVGDIGTHNAFFTVVGTGVLAKIEYTVIKATPTLDCWPTASSITLGQKLGDSVISGGIVSGVPGEGKISGKFIWDNPNYIPQEAGRIDYPITFIPDSKNYNSISCGTILVTVVEPKALEVPFADVAEQEAEIKVPFETQTEQASVLPVEELKPAEEAAPAEEVKPAEETKPVEEVKPEEAAKPVEEAA